MKALSVKQPHAGRIARGEKTIETRKWPTKHRGPVLICASMTIDPAGMTFEEAESPRGMALCVANIIDCRPMKKEDEAAAMCDLYPKAYAWVLSDIRPILPVPVKGMLGLFEVYVPIVIPDQESATAS